MLKSLCKARVAYFHSFPSTMFIGHYGVSLAARPTLRSVPLWVWFLAAQWLDVLWALLVLADVEKFRIVPGFTAASPLDLYYQPYTHSLPGSLAASLALGAIVALFTPRRRIAVLLLVAAVSFSHWLLDLVVHVPDLPLYDDSAKVGLGLWRHVALSFPLELTLLLLGAWVYARWMTFPTRLGRYAFWTFIAILAAFQIGDTFGPLPTSPKSMALAALTSYAVLTLTAALLERFLSE